MDGHRLRAPTESRLQATSPLPLPLTRGNAPAARPPCTFRAHSEPRGSHNEPTTVRFTYSGIEALMRAAEESQSSLPFDVTILAGQVLFNGRVAPSGSLYSIADDQWREQAAKSILSYPEPDRQADGPAPTNRGDHARTTGACTNRGACSNRGRSHARASFSFTGREFWRHVWRHITAGGAHPACER
jgi:hypothetical protein